jgi:cell division septation protein DedD
MTVHVATADDSLGHRTRRPQMRDVSHRFRRQGHIWMRRWFRLALGISVVVLLALTLRPMVVERRPSDLARRPGPAEAPAVTPQAAAIASPVLAAGPVAPDPVLRVQLASFLDPRNAARMVEGLRDAGLQAETRVVESRHVRYRILATPGKGENDEQLLARLQVLGFSPEVTDGAVAVTGFVSTEDADETASRLEDDGIGVRVEQESRAVWYHAVRVGAYRTSEAAKRAQVELAALGLVGIVVRVQDTEAIEPTAGAAP